MSWKLRTPVAFLIFNRRDKVKRVFDEIARARPPKLLLIADGPRPDRPDDEEKVRLTRAIVENVDWDCEVLTNYSETNLGTTYRPATGLNWVFNTVEEAIFLEEDCLPHPSFFRFCDELLEKYRDDERVMMISGSNFMRERKVTPYSYFFSQYVSLWGFATWRRAWHHYDVDLRLWPRFRDSSLLENVLRNRSAIAFWRQQFDSLSSGRKTTWDTQWQFACWSQNGLCLAPSTNLVSNIGFGADAAHYVKVDPVLADVPTSEMSFPLEHPPGIVRSAEVDEFISHNVFRSDRWIHYFASVARRFFPSLYATSREMAAQIARHLG